MENGLRFNKDGTWYEAINPDIKYIAKNKSFCILPKNASKGITIKQALREGLIRRVAPSDNDDLFKKSAEIDSYNSEDDSTFEKSCISQLKPRVDHSVNDNIFFMPVDQLRAQVFLAHGIIYPIIYDKTTLSTDFNDYQRKSPADLLLFEKPQTLRQNQLLLKILLQPDEIAASERKQHLLRLSVPIPISRLTGIDVPHSAGDLDRYINGWVKPDVPVPRHLFSTANNQSDTDDIETLCDSDQRSTKPIPEIIESISKFDRYMGVMAFLRNTSRYFSEKTGSYADYPEAFFLIYEHILGRKSSSIQSRNPVPEALLLALLDLDSQITPAAASVLTLVRSHDSYIEKEKARALAMDIYKSAGAKDTLAQAFKTLFSGDYRSAIRALQNPEMPMEAAVLAALFKFSGRQSHDYRIVKQRLHEDWSNLTQVSLALAALGAYHGYTVMDAQETSLYSVHPMIRPLIVERPDIKFHLTSNFERRLIESLYQRAFHSTESVCIKETLFNRIISKKAADPPRSPRLLICDSSYTVQDLFVRRYEITLIGRIISRLKAWKKDTIDEKSEIGKYLMSECFLLADEFEFSKKGEKQIFCYRIAKSKLIDLISEGKIAFNQRIMDLALEIDIQESNR